LKVERANPQRAKKYWDRFCGGASGGRDSPLLDDGAEDWRPRFGLAVVAGDYAVKMSKSQEPPEVVSAKLGFKRRNKPRPRSLRSL